MARDVVAQKVASVTREFAKSLSWSLRVPGVHSGADLTYDELLAILAGQERDFLADTKSLRDHVRLEFQKRFEGFQRAPNMTELRSVAEQAILAWILGRFDRRVRDVRIRANDPAYLRWKIKHGFKTTPGQKTGELRDAIETSGKVKVTT